MVKSWKLLLVASLAVAVAGCDLISPKKGNGPGIAKISTAKPASKGPVVPVKPATVVKPPEVKPPV